MRQYRIGEFAKYLGVTPDLLKHYEELGLLKPVRSKSGYRYYSFDTAFMLFESIRLRNYGMTLREIQLILAQKTVSGQKMEERFRNNMEVLRMEASFNQALADDYEEFLEWREPLRERDADWSIRWSRPMCFLPHAVGDEFLDNPELYDIHREWMSLVPLVKASLQVRADGKRVWGLIIERSKLERLGLPVNAMVEEIPSHKLFYYQFKGRMPEASKEAPDQTNPAFRLLAAMNLKAKHEYYRTSVMPCDWEKGFQYQYGYYAVPVLASPADEDMEKEA